MSLPLLLGAASSCSKKASFVEDVFDRAQVQYRLMVETTDTLMYPRTVYDDNVTTRYVPALPIEKGENWTTGFYPGILWYLYEYTGDEFWKTQARISTNGLEPQKMQNYHHDIGFIMSPSFGNALRLAPEEGDREVLIQAANTALTRFSPKVGAIQSWNPKKSRWGEHMWYYPVIIDNMMNLELLFEATKMTGDSTYYHAAVSHADLTMKNHVRKDASIYHVVDYDPETGEVKTRETSQGFSDESAWSRGQSWGIYGFTMCYRYTGKPEYLETAVRTADYFINAPSTPEDGIPYWDFTIGETEAPWDYDPEKYKPEPRDASAAAVAASALLELSGYVAPDLAEKYVSAAEKMLRSLATPEYMAEEGGNNYFLLKHSTTSLPTKSGIDKPLIYADYYYLEALLRYIELSK